MTTALAGPYVASAALLGLAGVVKLARPGDTAGALRSAGLTGKAVPTAAQRLAVRAGAAAEIAVAVAAVAAPGPLPPALVAASYGALAAFVALALRRGWPLSSCGCFGKDDAPPAVSHVVLDAAAAAVAAAWALAGPPSVGAAFANQPAAGVPLALTVAVTCALAYLAFTYPLAPRRSTR